MASDRLKFIRNLFDSIEDKPYVLLKHTASSLSLMEESADLDILLEKEYWTTDLIRTLRHPSIEKYEFRREFSVWRWFIFFKDRGFLQIDFLGALMRKSLCYLDHKALLLEASTTSESLRVPSNFHFLEHVVLFNFLNKAGVPEKYICFWKKMEANLQKDIIDRFNSKYQIQIQNFHVLSNYNEEVYRKLKKQVLSLPQNRVLRRLKNLFHYYRQTIRSCWTTPGIAISFSGVDGAGKSTIMDDVEQILRKKYRHQVVRLRHRPCLLPILSSFVYGKKEAERRTVKKMPRQGKNENRLSSLLRFLYYYSDYLIGQIYVHFNYLARGKIVLYDRYYFDFIVDGRRSNIRMNSYWPQWLYRFVLKPDLNVFLYATPDVIRKRKKELSAEEILELTKSYHGLFLKLSADAEGCPIYIAIENIDRKETVQAVVDQYLKLK